MQLLNKIILIFFNKDFNISKVLKSSLRMKDFMSRGFSKVKILWIIWTVFLSVGGYYEKWQCLSDSKWIRCAGSISDEKIWAMEGKLPTFLVKQKMYKLLSTQCIPNTLIKWRKCVEPITYQPNLPLGVFPKSSNDFLLIIIFFFVHLYLSSPKRETLYGNVLCGLLLPEEFMQLSLTLFRDVVAYCLISTLNATTTEFSKQWASMSFASSQSWWRRC